jgi:2-polyprenyl-3-methyl-5-hydroxy-6-metoxy-1,4-benzoquinol methylase
MLEISYLSKSRREYYNQVYERNPLAYKVPRSDFYSKLLDLLPCEKGKRLLDVGCGGGWLLKSANKRDLITIGGDLSTKALKNAKEQISVSYFVCFDAENMPFRDNVFDYVTCIGVLEHLPHPDQAIREMARVVCARGYALIVVPNGFSLVNFWVILKKGDLKKEQPIEHFMSLKQWIKLIEDSGLKLLKVYRCNHLSWTKYDLANLLYRFFSFFVPFNLSYAFIFICTKGRT